MKLETGKRVLTGLAGPISFAAANFAISLLLQQASTAHDFGLYAFGQVVIGAWLGLSNGLFSSPIVVALASNPDDKRTVFGSFFSANLIFIATSALISFFIFYFAKSNLADCFLFSATTSIMLFRWFGRSCDLASHSRKTASLSDVTYGLLGCGFSIFLYVSGSLNLSTALLVQIVAAAVSSIPSAKNLFIGARGIGNESGRLQVYRRSFSAHGKWAVSAVAATQVTANFHSYLVTFALGAGYFAPLALATLLYRPIGVVLTGLVQFERPRLAAKAKAKSVDSLQSDVRFIAVMVIATWLLNTVAISASIAFFPAVLNRDGYNSQTIFLALILTGAVVMVRALREPRTAALQAAGEFKGLARVTAFCAPVTIAAVTIVLIVAPDMAALSLLGALFGEVLNLILTNRIYGRFISELTDQR